MAKKIQDGNQIVTNVDSNDNLTFSIKSSFIDSTPTTNSTNLVTSGGVKSALDINTTDIDNLEITVGTLSTNVNANTTKIGTLSNLTTTSKTNLVSAINELETDKLETSAVVNEASTDTDKTYSADYLNDKLVSVGTTAPTDGKKVWFKKSKNLINYEDYTGTIKDYYFVSLPSTKFSLEAGKTYTLSFDIVSSVTPFAISVGAGQSGYAVDIKQTNSHQNGRNSITFTPTETQLANGNILFFRAPRYGTSQSSVTFTISNVQLEEGSTATSYEPYIEQSIKVDNEDFVSMSDLVSVGANQPGDGKRVWFKKSNNLLPTNKYISTTTINGVIFTNNGDGTFNISGTATANKTIEIIPENNFQLEQGQAYYLYSSVPYNASTFNLSIAMTDNGSLKFFTANNTYTPTTQPTQERLGIYIPSGTTVNATNVKLMLVKGNTAPRVYEPYVEPSINVDKEEWYNPNNIEKYSINETKIGTWIDGKPLYRKVIPFTPTGDIPANTWTTLFNYTFTNLKQLIKSTVLNTDSTNTGEINWLTVQYFLNDNAFKGLNTRNITVTLPTNSLIIVEYTKTTD